MKLADIAQETIGWKFKGIPARFADRTVGELAAAGVPVGEFGTPLLTLDEPALDHNLKLMAAFCERAGVLLAPHGKTTMAPQLFARQQEAGAWGITVATIAQVRVARAFGVPNIILGNELIDADSLAWLAAERERDPRFVFFCFVDSLEGVEAMETALAAAGASEHIDVLIEVGAPGGRCGVRTVEEGIAIADAVAAAKHLFLAGVAGFEGAVPGAVESQGATVDAYLRTLRALAIELARSGHFDGFKHFIVSAGGSAWFDHVLSNLTSWPEDVHVKVILRSGAYITHDDGLYTRTSPFNRGTAEGELRPALRLRGRVVSVPEPGLAVLDFGKRDAPIDKDLPTPLWIEHADYTVTEAGDTHIADVHDQHMTLRFPPETRVGLGDVVVCGISHPCTAFDKWQLVPVVRDGVVVDLIRTYF